MSHYWPTHSWIRGILSPAAVAVGLVATTATAWADGGDKHLGVQMRPIPLGVSGSSIEFIESKGRLFCYAGTLGTLVVDAFGEQYILSNNHVLAKEGQSLLGEEIIQPGLLDEGSCTLSSGNPGNVVAHLTDYEPLRFGKGKNKPVNTIDAAIAATVAGAVDDDGQILDIGTISGAPAAAALNMAVQKSGRTTGHTFGFILATSVDIDVKYDGGTARFENQIRIRHVCDGQDFSDNGDSGSLIITVADNDDRQAVGLLFAGGDADTFANPIDSVLSRFGVAPVAGTDNSWQGANDTVTECPTDTGGDGGGGGNNGRGGGRPFVAANAPGLVIATDVKSRNSAALFNIPGVLGHGVGIDANGEAAIEVYVESRSRRPAGRPIPAALEGVPVRIIETGSIRAF